MTPSPYRIPRRLVALVLVAAGAGMILWWSPWSGPAVKADPFPLPPISASPYLNTGPEAAYVGSAECRRCHDGRHGTFRTTGMGRSMADVDPAVEPPDASFEDRTGRRRYEVRRRDGQMWHRELLLGGGPDEILLAEYPLRYLVGSGRHSRTYLVEADGFLVESPVTWYTSRQGWDLSPGYTGPDHPGFERATGEGCLFCHAGRSEAVGPSLHRMRVHEAAIACERCHGPGSLHVARHTTPATPGEADLTIVNPARLSRDLSEAICQQCHLRTTAMIEARGRRLNDFRPGLPLEDFLHAYYLDGPERSMTVVGHVEQMHLSRCYQTSGTLTCLTCHDPHGAAVPAARGADYKATCQQCHTPEKCTVARPLRDRESPSNDCIQCHMPKSKTEIPHLAFTHHRIGIHGKPARTAGPRPGDESELISFHDLSRLGEVDRRRSLGLGYLEAANREKDPRLVADLQQQSLGLLTRVTALGVPDPAVEVGLARLRFDLGQGDVIGPARQALARADLVGQDRCTALYLLAEELARAGQHAEAVEYLRELIGLRRHPADWLLLAECRRTLGDRAGGDEAARTAARINPRLWKVHRVLADEAARQGKPALADWHRARAVP